MLKNHRDLLSILLGVEEVEFLDRVARSILKLCQPELILISDEEIDKVVVNPTEGMGMLE